MAVDPVETTRWRTYVHVDNPALEYDVEEEAEIISYVGSDSESLLPVGASGWKPRLYKSPDNPGELCVRLRSIRNLHLAKLPGRTFDEENHIPAFTFMPEERFREKYRRKREEV